TYLEVNPDIAAAGVNPFSHYIVTGRGEGRSLKIDLGFRYEILKAAPSLEDRVRWLRESSPDPEPSDVQHLVSALQQVGASTRLHITISHDDFTANLGGVQLCLTRESEAMRARDATHIHLYPAAAGLVIEFERRQPMVGVLINGERVGFFSAETLVEHLGPFATDRVLTFAVHSFLGHSIITMTAVLRAMNAQEGFFWIHDFASVCANYALMRNDVAFCGAPPPDSPACSVCLYGRRRRIHLAEHGRFFQAFAMTVLAPSQAALDLWLSSFPVKPAATKVHPHAKLRKRKADGEGGDRRGPLKVAFLGMPAPHKGWPVYERLVERFADDPRYEFHHLGKTKDPAIEAKFTAVEPTPEIAEPMAAAVEALEIDVAVIWSLCPETFCFTAYEAVAGGAKVVTNPDAGNVPRFVAETKNGLVAQDEHALMAMFQRGDVLPLGRAVRGQPLYSLSYSKMSADFVAETLS
ncbi:glycosyltransferase family 4 protein, partial [Caulobacter sp. BP25]|uniref:glycosyltransferase family 4 protein n=1 Tax=Caulobacter sp. BP25 TaxID=2048900 RepID=UPI000C13AAD2